MQRLVLIISLIVVFTLVMEFSIFKNPQATEILLKPENQTCVINVEEKTVHGTSLSGLIEPGSTVKILFGYYNCNEIRRGDIVVYNYSGNPNPIIKIVKGIPGDLFHLQKTESGYNILINGEIVKNSQSEPYLLGESGYRMLSLYENDYKDVIPANAYLLLGNIASGSLDSTHFGLIGKDDITGKVEY